MHIPEGKPMISLLEISRITEKTADNLILQNRNATVRDLIEELSKVNQLIKRDVEKVYGTEPDKLLTEIFED